MDKSYYQIKCEEIAEGSPLQVMSCGKTKATTQYIVSAATTTTVF